MTRDPILLVGGSGAVGRWTARQLRAAHPTVPLLIGGRDLTRAEDAAAEVGGAQGGVEGVALDLAADDLGERPGGAVAVLFRDIGVAGLRFAQARGVPHVSIAWGVDEIGPEVAAYAHHAHAPGAAPVVLGAEWLVGATTVPTLEMAKAFGRVHDITIGALLDEQDAGGPAWAADLERLTTGAPNVQFHLATGVSSTRRRGEPMSTEIVVELAGEDHAGRPLRTHHAVVHPEGQFPLTGLGVAMVLERLTGLDGRPATPPGLYFPYQLLDPTDYFARLEQAGGAVLKLEVP